MTALLRAQLTVTLTTNPAALGMSRDPLRTRHHNYAGGSDSKCKDKGKDRKMRKSVPVSLLLEEFPIDLE
jgi:hypothetical protein